jgi:hypothetical protein
VFFFLINQLRYHYFFRFFADASAAIDAQGAIVSPSAEMRDLVAKQGGGDFKSPIVDDRGTIMETGFLGVNGNGFVKPDITSVPELSLVDCVWDKPIISSKLSTSTEPFPPFLIQ